MILFDFFTPKNETFYLNSSSTIRQALEKFNYHKFTVISLVDENGKFVSTISEGDILRYINEVLHFDNSKFESVKLSDIEKYRPYQALNINTNIDDVYKLALDQNFIPLIDDRGMYIGILKRKTILEYLLRDKL